jgi:hypothetical protein
VAHKPLSAMELDDLSADARDAINNKAMQRVWDDLETTYINRLKSSNVGDLTANTAHASLRVLEDVKAQLQLYATKRIK